MSDLPLSPTLSNSSFFGPMIPVKWITTFSQVAKFHLSYIKLELQAYLAKLIPIPAPAQSRQKHKKASKFTRAY